MICQIPNPRASDFADDRGNGGVNVLINIINAIRQEASENDAVKDIIIRVVPIGDDHEIDPGTYTRVEKGPFEEAHDNKGRNDPRP